MEEQEFQNLPRRERRKILREQEKGQKAKGGIIRKLVYWVGGFVIIGLLVAGGWWLFTRPGIPEEEIISRKGVHWHPELRILIKGEEQEITANLGLGAVHQPIHTHDSTGVLHIEVKGIVTKEDIKLGRFFKIWGKQFNSNCVFEFCNGEEGTVKMLVNGQENKEFENYEMKDKDKIEVRYE